jgi:hypothetical protein
MENQKSNLDLDQLTDFQQRIRILVGNAPWVLRITDLKDKPAPVFIVKKRYLPDEDPRKNVSKSKTVLRDQGFIYGQSLRRCLPVIRLIINGVCDEAGVPLELQQYTGNGRITFRGNLPLDEEAGTKLSLIFQLQARVKDLDRVELIAWRVERFSREEAAYWLTRATQSGAAANRWAQAGMRIMLGGQPDDKAILNLLEKLRR